MIPPRYAEAMRAGKAALCFSGGKDSLACLLLLKEFHADLRVIFVNTGHAYPETLAMVDKARALCPHFVEVRTDRDGQWEANGLPSDLLPIDWTLHARQFCGSKPVMVQSYLQCCYENIMLPAWQAGTRLGITLMISGQRADEEKKAPVKTGTVHDGVELWHPIEDWTKEQVLDFCAADGPLPPQFALEHSSMDCSDCTAYAKHSRDRAQYARINHPELHADYLKKLRRLHDAMAEPMEHYEAILRDA